MSIEVNLVKKGELIQRLVAFVKVYHETFNKPVSMKILSQRYAKQARPLGGFEKLIDELKAEASVEVVMNETGGRVVYPPNCLCVVKPKERLL